MEGLEAVGASIDIIARVSAGKEFAPVFTAILKDLVPMMASADGVEVP